jgi:uncharacterized paraquat-inducible protein A
MANETRRKVGKAKVVRDRVCKCCHKPYASVRTPGPRCGPCKRRYAEAQKEQRLARMPAWLQAFVLPEIPANLSPLEGPSPLRSRRLGRQRLAESG